MDVRFPKVYKSWSLPCLNLPRWIDANSFDQSFFDDLPERLGNPGTSFTVTNYPSNSVPIGYQLSSTSAINDTNLLRTTVSILKQETDFINQSQKALKSFTSINQAEGLIVWYTQLSSEDTVTNAVLTLSTGTVALRKANSLHELSTTPEWCYYQQDSLLIVSGFDIVDLTTNKDANNWHYLPTGTYWDQVTDFWILNPETNQWHYSYASGVSDETELQLLTNNTVSLRFRVPSRVDLLKEIKLTVDDTDYTCYRKVLSADVDDKLSIYGEKRRFEETNYNMTEMYYRLNNFSDYTKNGFRSALSILFRRGANYFFDSTTTSETLANTLPVTIRNFDSKEYVIASAYTSTSNFVSPFNLVATDEVFTNNKHKKPTFYNSNRFDFFQDGSANQSVVVRLKFTNFQQLGNALSFTVKNKEEIILAYQPAGVDIDENTKKEKIKSFWTSNIKSGQALFV